jgi:GDP-L-fucose synthase
MMDLNEHRILVTGASGFLGQAVVRLLSRLGHDCIKASSSDVDLRKASETSNYFTKHQPTIVFHCAVQGGGIGWMKSHPVESGRDNFRININVLDAAHKVNAHRFIGVSSACVYPKFCPVPFSESDVWNGFPEPTNATYALSKRAMMELGRAYSEQYQMHCVFPILANLYGPGDHLDPARAHVVADLMIRCRTNPSQLVVWGTGTPTREFLHVEDAARALLACLNAPSGSVINVGTGIETPIADLARHVLDANELDVPIVLDSSKPDGQPRKVLDVEKAKNLIGWSAQINLHDGLRQTALWYQRQ